MIKILIKRLSKEVSLPKYETAGSSGMDLAANIVGNISSGTGHGEMGKYPGYEFQDELNNPMQYEKGIVAMANRGPNTNGSQFFIMHVDYPLPYDYTIFGKVSNGIDVVDAIANVQTGDMDKPVDDVVINSVDIKEN